MRNWWAMGTTTGAHLPGVRQDAFGSPTMMAWRWRHGDELSKMHHHNDPLNLSWTSILMVVVLGYFYRIKTSNWFIDSFKIFMFAWKCLFQSFPLKAPKNNLKTQSPVPCFAWCCTSSAHQPRCNAFTSNIWALAATRRKACDHEDALDNAWSTLEVKMPYRRTHILHWAAAIASEHTKRYQDIYIDSI